MVPPAVPPSAPPPVPLEQQTLEAYAALMNASHLLPSCSNPSPPARTGNPSDLKGLRFRSNKYTKDDLQAFCTERGIPRKKWSSRESNMQRKDTLAGYLEEWRDGRRDWSGLDVAPGPSGKKKAPAEPEGKPAKKAKGGKAVEASSSHLPATSSSEFVPAALQLAKNSSGVVDHDKTLGILCAARGAQPPPSASPVLARAINSHAFQQGASLGHEIRRVEEVADLRDNEVRELEKRLNKKPSDWKQKKLKLNDEVQSQSEGSQGFMGKAKFAAILKKQGLLTLQPGAPHEGQHVFHIIAAANGGPDHTDNYLYALGGQFNIMIGEKLDHLNCFLAGKEKARKAVAIALKVANDPALHKHIDKRGKPVPTTYTDGRHKGEPAETLFKQGGDVIRDIRKAAR